MAVIFSTSPDCSLTQGLTGGVHLNFEMTKDPQPWRGKYGPHTFCSGHAHVHVYGCHFSILPNAIDVSLTEG